MLGHGKGHAFVSEGVHADRFLCLCGCGRVSGTLSWASVGHGEFWMVQGRVVGRAMGGGRVSIGRWGSV